MKPYFSSTTFRSILLTAWVASTASSYAIVVVNDGFETGTHPAFRSVAISPGTPYYGSSSTSSATLGTDANFVGGAGNRALIVTATSNYQLTSPIGGTVSLGTVGDSLTYSFSFRFTNTPTADAGAFRFGLHSSAGTASAEGFGSLANDDFGYYMQIGASSVPATNNSLYVESGGMGTILSGNDRASITASGAGTSITDQLVHNVSLTITRTTATQMGFSWTIDGVARTATSNTLMTSFDQISFSNGFTGTVAQYNIDNVLLDATTFIPVPEPTALALVSLGALGFFARRRRA